MTSSHPTAAPCQWFSWLAAALDRRSVPRLALLFLGDVLADLRDGLVELGLAAARDEHIGALFNEPPGGREADAAAAPRDDGDLVFQ